MQNLIDIMIMLCMRPADVGNLYIKYYKADTTEWYNPKYSWYCTGYAKNKKDEPRPLVSMEKDPLLARELLIWIQKAIPNKFPFLIKDKDGDVNVHPINNFLAIYGISSSHLRKIGSEHAITIHGGKNDAHRKRLCQLALRHKVINIASDHYSVMNDRPIAPTTRKSGAHCSTIENTEISDIIDLYNY